MRRRFVAGMICAAFLLVAGVAVAAPRPEPLHSAWGTQASPAPYRARMRLPIACPRDTSPRPAR